MHMANLYMQESEFTLNSIILKSLSVALPLRYWFNGQLLWSAAVEPDLVDLRARPAVDGTKLALLKFERSASASAIGPETSPPASDPLKVVYPASTASSYVNYLFSGFNVNVIDWHASTVSAMLGPSNRIAIGELVGELDGVNSATRTDGDLGNSSTAVVVSSGGEIVKRPSSASSVGPFLCTVGPARLKDNNTYKNCKNQIIIAPNLIAKQAPVL